MCPRRLSRQLAERARHDVVFAEQQAENVEQRAAAGPELLRHHDDRDHRHPRPALLVSKPVPVPVSLGGVREQPREEGCKRREIAAFGGMRRRPVAIEDGQAVFRDVGRGLSERDWIASMCARSGCVIQTPTTVVFLSPPRGPSSTIV